MARLTDELEEKNRELARQNRLADLGRMASHVAHEVRNSLVPVNLYMSLLRRRLADDAGSLDVLAKVEAGFTALDATVNDLLNFTAHREPQWRSFIVQDLVEEIFDALAPQLEAQGIDVSLDVPPQHGGHRRPRDAAAGGAEPGAQRGRRDARRAASWWSRRTTAAAGSSWRSPTAGRGLSDEQLRTSVRSVLHHQERPARGWDCRSSTASSRRTAAA